VALRTLVLKLILIALWLLVFLVGFFFWHEFQSPFNFALGLPLMLLGATMGIASFWEIFVSLFSWRWSREHCPFCSQPEEIKDILSSQDGFK